MSAVTFSLLDTVTTPAGAAGTAARAEPRGMGEATTFDIVTTRAGFDALAADWTALFDRAGRGEQMFIGYNWLWHWTRHYLGNDRLAIVTARRNGRLVLVMPFVLERVARLTQLAFMGAPVSQYGDVLVDEIPDASRVIDDAWQYLCRQQPFDLARLAKVRADATIAPHLARFGFATTAEAEAPYASLGACADYAAFEARNSAKQRKNRRRQLRRLEERGRVEVRWLTAGEEARDGVRLTMTLKRAWLTSKALVSKAFKDERFDAFFADAIASRSHPCGVSLSLLTSNGEGCDANISVSCKGRRCLHILAYNLKFEKYGVGNHHLDLHLERAFQDGMQVYDFLAPRHAYKMEWADGVMAVRDHSLAVSPLGRLYVDIYLARVREAMKHCLARLPAPVRRAIAGAHTSVP